MQHEEFVVMRIYEPPLRKQRTIRSTRCGVWGL